MDTFRCLPCDEQLAIASDMVSHIATKQFHVEIPGDFLRLALTGMHKLASEGRSNVIYGLCKGLELAGQTTKTSATSLSLVCLWVSLSSW